MSFSDLDSTLLEFFWEFSRSDIEINLFEDRLYNDTNIETALGEHIYLEAISVDFREDRKVQDYKAQLAATLPKPASCLCHTMPNQGVVDLGQWSADDFDVLEQKVGGCFWLHRLVCKECQTVWLVAEDDCVYDVWLLFRGARVEVPELKTYRGLLAWAVRVGAFVEYVDPLHSMELPAAIQTLAEETPGISVRELSKLLPIDAFVTEHHARMVVAEHGSHINF